MCIHTSLSLSLSISLSLYVYIYIYIYSLTIAALRWFVHVVVLCIVVRPLGRCPAARHDERDSRRRNFYSRSDDAPSLVSLRARGWAPGGRGEEREDGGPIVRRVHSVLAWPLRFLLNLNIGCIK